MSSFVVGGKTYELVTMADVKGMELGDVEILETLGGLDIAQIDDHPVTIKLVVVLVYLSMRKSEAADDRRYGDAVQKDPLLRLARQIKLDVLKELTVEVKAEGDAVPPIEEPSEPETSGPLDLVSVSG